MADTVIDTERPLRADARRNRERILESARACFRRVRADAQIDDVARQAGVGVGTVYRHFPTKEALLVELLREKFRLFAARAREALEQDGEPFAVLEDLLRRNAETAAATPPSSTRWRAPASTSGCRRKPSKKSWSRSPDELIARARRAGTIRQDVEANDIAMLMCGLCSTMGASRVSTGADTSIS